MYKTGFFTHGCIKQGETEILLSGFDGDRSVFGKTTKSVEENVIGVVGETSAFCKRVV